MRGPLHFQKRYWIPVLNWKLLCVVPGSVMPKNEDER